MTPTQIETAARNKYNSVGSNFYSSAEVLDLMYEACLLMANEALLIEGTDTSISTVAGTQSYALPARVMAVKRVEYDGQKLTPVSLRQDDQLTFNNSTTTEQGTPAYYYIWNGYLYLRPIPSGVATVKLYTIKEPAVLTSVSTLEIPSQFHLDIVNYIVSEMCAKDENLQMATYYLTKWEKGLEKAIKWRRRRDVTDGFKVVLDEESLNTNILGPI